MKSITSQDRRQLLLALSRVSLLTEIPRQILTGPEQRQLDQETDLLDGRAKEIL